MMRFPIVAASLALLLQTGCGQSEDRHGAWLVDIKLCADNVASFRRLPDPQTGGPALRIKLNEPMTRELESMTQRYVDQELPLTVNGDVVFKPILIEPLTTGTILVSDVTEGAMADIIAYMELPC